MNKPKKTTKPEKAPDKPLSAQMLRFVDEYVIDTNGTQAAIRAGYSAKTANEQAARLLAKVSIQKLIKEKLDALSKQTGFTAEKVLREMGRVALSDARKLFNENGVMKPIAELDDDIAACIASIEVDALFEGHGEDRIQVGTTQKIKLWDKNSAAEKLMKHLGLFKKDNEQKIDPLAELLGLIAERGNRLPIKE
jgi:phage terminase small subunit